MNREYAGTVKGGLIGLQNKDVDVKHCVSEHETLIFQ